MQQSYEVGAIGDLSTWTYRGAVKWELTPFILFQLTANRELGSPSFAAGLSSRIDNEVAARVDYAIRRDLILSGVVGHVWSDFEDTDRQDTRLKARAKAEYFFLPRRSVYVSYDFEKLDPGLATIEGYQRNIVMTGVKMRF